MCCNTSGAEHMTTGQDSCSMGNCLECVVVVKSVFVREDSHFIKTDPAIEMEVIVGRWILKESIFEGGPVGIGEFGLVRRGFWVKEAFYGHLGSRLGSHFGNRYIGMEKMRIDTRRMEPGEVDILSS